MSGNRAQRGRKMTRTALHMKAPPGMVRGYCRVIALRDGAAGLYGLAPRFLFVKAEASGVCTGLAMPINIVS